ncbi:TlpA disulfide reductase family protein [Aquimarina intermedia]|uniref:AhpC/TSA family protein n=1 Tax=Aquimarina intermedia TaxID=350814 RepID=A0A5S5C5Q2_9FLAO|nr:TlpA disulfide reductase family protein [Aquimarina intermedia]TYP73650.1 AhpC/TSA family protein [Aquimarina intermedia]
MKKISFALSYLVLIGFLLSCKQKPAIIMDPIAIVEAKGYAIPVYDFENFKVLLGKKDDKIRVVNFWATWCKPCIEEMPYFELVNSAYADKNVEVILVSLDVPSQIESKLIPYLERQNIQSQVVVLDDPDANSWIPKVDEDWTGAIPATYIYKGNECYFYEQSFSYNELEKELKKFIP